MSWTPFQRGSLRRDADDLRVGPGLVVHVHHADRPGLHPHAREHRILQQHESVERVAVAAERVGDEAVVGGIRGRREQPAVEEDPARVVVDLVLVAAAARDLDDDVHAALGGLRSWRPSCHVTVGGRDLPSRRRRRHGSVGLSMEFRRITNLPPYVFTIINNLKIEARRAGADVIDLGFGNPDIPSPQIAVEKLAEAAATPATTATR